MELHRVNETDGMLVADSSVGAGRDRGWILWSSTAEKWQAFSLDIELPDDPKAVAFGILGDSVKLAEVVQWHAITDTQFAPWYRFQLSASGDKVDVRAGSKACETSINWQGHRKIGLDFFHSNKQPRVHLRIGAKVFDVTAEFPDPIASGDYRPCVSVRGGGLKFRCQVSLRSSKRKLEADAFVSKMCRKSWECRKYTDMAVYTSDDHCIPCHRAQLAQASPVFEADLDRWSGDQPRIRVEGDKAAVEALLSFCYTGELDSQQDATAVVELAHRYQIDDLVTIAANRILETLTPETIVPAMRALRPLREQGSLKLLWRELCVRTSLDVCMIERLGLAL